MAAGIFGALKYMPATLARKALVKVHPSLGNYFSRAVTYGVDANRALDYLIEKFESDSQKDHKRRLEQGAQQGTLRPDEMVSRSEMKNAAIPGKILKGAASLAIGGGLGRAGEEQPQEQMSPQLSKEDQRVAALAQFNERLKKKRPASELSREELIAQFQQAQQDQGRGQQGKAALLQTMQEITEALRQMRGNG